MKGMIMAGGSGQRLRPVTCLVPKPLLPVLGKPVMENALERLQEAGIAQVGATLSYRAEQICERFNGRVRCYVENSPMGTAGSLLQAKDFLDETFVIVSGDALTDMDLTQAIRFHRERGALATMVLKKVENPLEYGVVLTDETGRVLRFLEKPGWDQVFSDQVNTGVYILEPELLSLIPKDRSYDFGRELFPALLQRGLPLYGYVTEGYWCDIGGVEQYLQAQMDALAGRIRGFGPGICEDAEVEEGALITGPVWIGQGSRICAGARIGPFCVVGRGCCIRPGASLRRSVLLDGVLVGERAEARGGLLMNEAQMLASSQMYEQSVLGDGAVLCEGASLADGAMVWPQKRVLPGERVCGNLRSGVSPLQWDARGVYALSAGLPGPGRFTALGEALAGSARGDVLLADDRSGAAQMAVAALCAGLTAAGGRAILAGSCSPQAMLTVGEDLQPSACVYLCLRNGRLCADLYDEEGMEFSPEKRRSLQAGLIHAQSAALELSQMRPGAFIPDCTAQRLARLLLLVGPDSSAEELRLQVPEGPLLEEAQALFRQGGSIRAEVCGDMESLRLLDEKGREVENSRLPLLYACVVHAFAPGAPVLGAWQDTVALEQLADAFGVRCLRCGPGRRERMLLVRNHPLYRTMYFDPLGALALLFRGLKMMHKSLAELVDLLPRTSIVQKRLSCANELKGAVLRSMAGSLRSRSPQLKHGIRLATESGAVAFLYPSESEESFILRCEAKNAEIADELFGDLEALLGRALADAAANK